jgi:pimeloyl-ACP methyl ester carboxylesterase
MKRQILFSVILFSIFTGAQAQEKKGTILIDSIYSENLENEFGEDPLRAVAVYLPPAYEASDKHYPVIYFLHGFHGDHKILPMMAGLLDEAIGSKRIRPFIMVVSDQKTSYEGSFYSNSGVFGNWEDFTAFDLVNYMDNNYRTIPKKESRGITGHSMGGYGAIKLGMHHPDIFSTVYALSPGVLTIVREYGPNSSTYRELSSIKTEEQLAGNYFAGLIVALGKSWSPNPENPPFFCDIPFEYQGEELHVNQDVLKKWHANMPMHMIDDNLDNLQKLKAIKMDWGRNAGDRFTIQCDMFSQRLENAGISHFAEEYIGTHGSGIYTREGRIPNQMLPFFDLYLDFE